MPWVARNSWLVVGPDRLLLRLTRGRFGLLKLVGMDDLVLHTRGRRAGLARESPLRYVTDGDRMLVAGSNWGKAELPGWVHNLRGGGPVEITVAGSRRPVAVRELRGAERDEAFATMGRSWPMFLRYAERAGRGLPVFELRL